LETEALIAPLADGWGFDVATIDYAPVGFGSYHWVATDFEGARVFVTVDDLERKPWLGDTRESVFDGLGRAFGSAVALRESGLGFVVAPILTRDGDPIRRIGARHGIALFPFVEGQVGQQFEHDTADERTAVLMMLAQLHQATPAVTSIARRIDLQLPGRTDLVSALQELDHPWSGGPFSEPARQAIARHASDVTELIGLLEHLRHEVARRITPWVVTHGEPHAVNVMRTDGGYVMVDWDTVAVAPRERDLWMVWAERANDATAYIDATGHRPHHATMDFFRLTWDLADLAAFINVLRAPHRDSEDTVKAYDGLTKCVAIRDQWAALLP
jgi:spectinomycin phosphotransferase